MDKVNSNEEVDVHVQFKVDSFILNEHNIFIDFNSILKAEDRLKYLKKIKGRIKLCVLDIETKSDSLLRDYIFGNIEKNPTYNSDAVNYIKVTGRLCQDRCQFTGDQIVIVETGSGSLQNKNKEIDPNVSNIFRGGWGDVTYYFPDIKENRLFLREMKNNFKGYLSELKNIVLPKIKLEIKILKNGLPDFANRMIETKELDLNDRPRFNFKKEVTKFVMGLLDNKLIDINETYFVRDATKRFIAELNKRPGVELSQGNRKSIRTYLSKFKSNYIQEKKKGKGKKK